MINVVPGPLIVRPETWTLVFAREASTWWAGFIAFGRYKHVRAYAYVPFLHVWVFYDVHFTGTEILVASEGPPARALIASWIAGADLIRINRLPAADRRRPPLLGFCVPAIKRLIGLRCGALRPDALYRSCLEHGGEQFEADDGRAKIPRAGG
jgi:hypothetical protein